MKSRSLLSDTVAIALTPVAAYCIAFNFEAGYLDHFGLPLWLIDLNLTRIFVVLTGLGFLIWITYYLLVFVPVKILGAWRWLKALFFPGLLTYLTYIVIRLALHENRAWWILGLITGAMAIYSVFEGVFQPLFKHRDLPSLTARLAVSQRAEALSSPDTALDIGLRRLTGAGFDIRLPLVAGIGFALLLPLASITGRITAERQTTYLVEEASSDFVALRSYGSYVIVASLDTVKNEVGPVYQIQPLSQTPSARWRLKYLGTLRVVSDSSRLQRAVVAPDSATSQP